MEQCFTMTDTYSSRLCVSKKVKRLIKEDCKEYYRKYHKIPKDIHIPDNAILKSMIQHYLDVWIDDGEE